MKRTSTAETEAFQTIVSNSGQESPKDHDLDSKSPRVSVVIPTFNRKTSLCKLLDSIQEMHPAPDEVIVVNDGSTDGTAGYVRMNYPGVKLIESPGVGHARARALGASAATENLIAFLEDDMIVPVDWLAKITKAFEDPDVGMAGSIIRNRDGTVWGPIVSFRRFGDQVTLLDETSVEPVEVQYANESGTVVRREVLRMQLVDYGLIGDSWGESISFYSRARRFGFLTVGVPQAILFHDSEAPGGVKERYGKGHIEYFYSWYANRTYVYLKYQATTKAILPLYVAYRMMYVVAHAAKLRKAELLCLGSKGVMKGLRQFVKSAPL